MNIKRDVLMVGQGTSAVCYYRVMLPALAMGCDWAGLYGYPPNYEWATGNTKGESVMPVMNDYRLVVLQEPRGESWEHKIESLQAAGVKVAFEVDDYLHGVGERDDHQFAEHFDKRALYQYQRCMELCDALIVSTDYIGRKYKKFNPNYYVCRNGIDLRRYELTKPSRPSINIGWAGATGHVRALAPWLQVVWAVMKANDNVNFVSIGMNFASAIKNFAPERTIAIPFAAIEQYPSAMSMFDVALAPGGGGSWYKGKSDLRWLEASALGIPTIARPSIYTEVEDGVTGFLATAPNEMAEPLVKLIRDAELRQRVGAAAEDHVVKHRSMDVMVRGWEDAFREICE